MFVLAIASEFELRRVRQLIAVERLDVHGSREFVFGTMAGRDVCLVKTGVGRKNAAAAARKICSEIKPELVIIAGAAGALDPGLSLGAVVVVESVVRENNTEKIFCPDEETRRVAALLCSAGMKAGTGRCCQVRTFMHRAVDKRALFEKIAAHSVDMESAAFAAEFQRVGVPFVNMRVVSDRAACDTADMETLVRLRYRRGKMAAALYLLRHPRELMRTIQFYRGMAIADKRIAEAVSALIASM